MKYWIVFRLWTFKYWTMKNDRWGVGLRVGIYRFCGFRSSCVLDRQHCFAWFGRCPPEEISLMLNLWCDKLKAVSQASCQFVTLGNLMSVAAVVRWDTFQIRFYWLNPHYIQSPQICLIHSHCHNRSPGPRPRWSTR